MNFKTEHQFQKWIADLAKKNGWRVHCNPDSRKSSSFSTPGFPDLVLTKPFLSGDLIVFAECKMPGKLLRTEQKDWLLALQQAKATIFVWEPEDEKIIESFLTKPKRGWGGL